MKLSRPKDLRCCGCFPFPSADLRPRVSRVWVRVSRVRVRADLRPRVSRVRGSRVRRLSRVRRVRRVRVRRVEG